MKTRTLARQWMFGAFVCVFLQGMVVVSSALGESPENPDDRSLAVNTPVSGTDPVNMPVLPTKPSTADTKPSQEHPLMPVIRWAKDELPRLENVQDYSARFVRRERVQGRLSGYEYMTIKVRHEPFSVYGCFEAPASVKGQEVIYVAGKNEGNMWAHKPGMRATFSIYPEGMVAMTGRNYPLTEIGILNLVRRLVEVGEQDMEHDECEVTYFNKAKVSKRDCTVIQVVHPKPNEAFRYHLARIFVDDELKLPVRYEAYTWPSEPDGDPELLEEFTYLDLKLNNGFTDEDFSIRNPAYHFEGSATKKIED